MKEREFNLLDEPWIRVLKNDMSEDEISLKKLLKNASQYKALSGEMETQDASVLRFLLAIVITILYRYDGDGNEATIDEDWDREEVLERWQQVWEKGNLPETAVDEYLDAYHDTFWLIDDVHPFYQVADLKYGTKYNTSKNLLGDLKESNNTATRHHFSMREGDELEKLSYAETARWLIHMNSYAVNLKWDAKAGGTKCNSFVGWLGRLGFIEFIGNNLFETLMLNATLLKDGTDVWKAPAPVWERSMVQKEQGVQVVPPDNLPLLYTLPSRRVRLDVENGNVVGYQAMLGEFFNAENYFPEQMTIWSKQEDKATEQTGYFPKLHREGLQSWREFSSIFDWNKADRIPGLVLWAKELEEAHLIEGSKMLHMRIVGQFYDGMKYLYTGYISDSLELSYDLLLDKGQTWIQLISMEIDNCNSAVLELGKFVDSLFKVAYGPEPKKEDRNRKKKKTALREKLLSDYYFEIDSNFRFWLSNIHADDLNKNDKVHEWHLIALHAAQSVSDRYFQRLHIDLFDKRNGDYDPIRIRTYLTRKLYELYPDCKMKGGYDEQKAAD